MSAKLFREVPEVAPDIGPHGYRQTMNVYLNQAPDAEALARAGVTHAYARTIIDNDLHRVGFSSQPGGLGMHGILEMSADDAAVYPIDAQVEFHFRKDKEIGFGTLVAVTPIASQTLDEEAEPAAAPRV